MSPIHWWTHVLFQCRIVLSWLAVDYLDSRLAWKLVKGNSHAHVIMRVSLFVLRFILPFCFPSSFQLDLVNVGFWLPDRQACPNTTDL